ncbi:ATP synthase subunit d, mitochondrial-like [Stylophora pistillata]|uniref:ATP synthase subunit d, mitochondrial n=1 Tax=Stylophora pistillata TaxID=50429 RepID=A0A2B4SAP3_STYPI|nr:ATP synthase subunit d, mitochondrial-like [Stylophora pistillata]PFX25890.1 ATP synthase subunit d, mitochondrial [Stylophora pistillata]
MAARRIGKYVPDWIKLATKCPEEGKPVFNRMRTKYENLKTRIDTVAPKPEPIHWDWYAKNITKPGMVEAFRKAEEYYIEGRKEADELIAECEAELAKIRNMKPFEEMSIDEFLDLHPEIKKEVEAMEKSGEWPDRTM